MSSFFTPMASLAVLLMCLPGVSHAQDACENNRYTYCDAGKQVQCTCDGSPRCNAFTDCSQDPFCNPINPTFPNYGSSCCMSTWSCTPSPQFCADGSCRSVPEGEPRPATGESPQVETAPTDEG
ncbi:hypothetical protein [Corallococcus caeni]|uniref:Uncharacterized protein n=1 Tax=Corallococcus caeni TaxID=3082388 RepID=A0ABQ6QJZ0_9BACT|nr:hypothetical protein ASNO1_05690 [Corallococcus sp. NO1]